MAVAPHYYATAFKRSALREAMTTSAPSLFANSAVARPMPEEPPTTTTFFPASSIPSPPILDFGLNLSRADYGAANAFLKASGMAAGAGFPLLARASQTRASKPSKICRSPQHPLYSTRRLVSPQRLI